MADYYPLIARAVTGLEKNTGEARRALYERARTALVAQLRGVLPAHSESDITRERLALEEAIRKVEAEAARRSRLDLPKAEYVPVPPPPPPPPPPARTERKPSSDLASPPEQKERTEPAASEVKAKPPPSRDDMLRSEPIHRQIPPAKPAREDAPAPHDTAKRGASPEREAAPSSARPHPAAPNRAPDRRMPSNHSSLVDEGLKGFREVIAESDDLGEAAANASKSARDVFEAFPPPPSREFERVEPQFALDEPPARELPSSEAYAPRPSPVRPRAAPPSRPSPEDFEEPHAMPRLGRGMGRKLALLAALLVLGALAFFGYRERASIAVLFQSVRPPATQATKETPQTRAKIADRVGGAQQDTSSAQPAPGSAAAVAQRVVLYEQQPNTAERKQYIGSVTWRAESVSPGPGLPPDVAIRAAVEIPERQMRMSFTIRRNTDQTLPASHTIEVLFSTPADFAPGGIADVPGVLMEQAEQSRGMPLAGLRVKVTSGFFLIGLSSGEADVRRNVQLLKERSWLHIPILYNNGQRALLAMEKGVPGDRVFGEAFAAWQQ